MVVGSIWKTAKKVSLGLVMVLFWGWIFLRADQLFPVNTAQWKSVVLTYSVFAALIFSFDALSSRKTERPLFEVSFIKAFPKFLIAAAITLGILFLFGQTVSGDALPTIAEGLASVGLGVLLLHAFFVATLEEKVFRGFVSNELRASGISKPIVWIMQAFIFAFFHYMLNGELLTLWIYIPLGLIFMYIKQTWTPRTDMANSGAHFAWNVFILGFLS